jgi:error-prone DNA polymerase
MGFYAPAQLVRAAREHGVVIRPIDVQVSAWDSTLEEPAKTAIPSARWDTRYREQLRAVRLGFSRIGGMTDHTSLLQGLRVSSRDFR